MEKERNTPSIRFKGFTGPWEQRKLGDIATITMGQSPTGSTYSEVPSKYILIQGNADLKNGWVIPRIWTTQITKFAKAGDLIMSVRAPAGAMGKTAYDAVIGRGVAAIKGNEFIYQVLSKMDKDGYWKKLAAGSTFESINSEAIQNAMIMIPNNEEQKPIGAYFQCIDSLITLHQRKLDHENELKEYLLRTMFPRKGKSIPRIRFPGFTGPWEKCKLGSVCSEIGDGLHSAPKFDENGGYYFINGNNLVNGKIVIDYSNTPKVSQETFNINNKHLDDSTILFSINGTIGNLAYYNGEPIMLGKSAAYLKANKIDKHFLYTLLQSPSILNSFMLCLTGTTIKNLGLEAIRNTDILMPTPKEQKLLGTLFSSLDDIIDFNQKKLESLKALKKGFLQKMFV